MQAEMVYITPENYADYFGHAPRPAYSGRQAGGRVAPITDPRAKLLAAERAADELPEPMVDGARYALAWCAADLRLSEPPALCFYDTGYSPMVAGFFERAPNEIWVNAALCFHNTARELLETVAHECAHAAQSEQWSSADYLNDARAEAAAAAYARRALARIR